MLEPRTEDERKALRLRDVFISYPGAANVNGPGIWHSVLTEARAIVREELGAATMVTTSYARAFELEQVRADITRTAAVVQAFSSALLLYPDGQQLPNYLVDQLVNQQEVLVKLLSRERELTAKSEPEGGDRK